ncbi:MAG TPA: type III-B CRISPR module-associated Cmr3 family protein, partial [Thermogutta sp.]|nr:type III-B CRISPR module-associated Cmr3 family protein [Thermogutta sp.]
MNQSILSAKTRLVALRLDPLDVLFFRDGRPFHEASRGESGLPRPQTLAGALRTHLLRRAGCDGDGFRKLGEYLRAGQSLEQAITSVCGAGWIARVEVRGPWLCEEVNGTLEILVSIPA